MSDFLSIEVRLTDQSDGFKQRCFLRNSNSYLRDRFAIRDFSSVGELITESLRLKGKVDVDKFAPDEMSVPVVAAMPAVRPGLRCFRCNKPGHKKVDCRAKPEACQNSSTQAQKGSRSGRPTKGKARFGKYDGTGRVHAVNACSECESDLSDDELRSGNELA